MSQRWKVYASGNLSGSLFFFYLYLKPWFWFQIPFVRTLSVKVRVIKRSVHLLKIRGIQMKWLFSAVCTCKTCLPLARALTQVCFDVSADELHRPVWWDDELQEILSIFIGADFSERKLFFENVIFSYSEIPSVVSVYLLRLWCGLL